MRSHLIFAVVVSCICVSAPVELIAQQKAEEQPASQLPFRISKETTYITAPITKSGLVDFTAYLNQQMSQGVTPATNAAVLYWQAIGNSEDISNSPEFFERMKQKLGTDPFAAGGPYLFGIREFAEESGLSADFDEDSTIGKQHALALDRPWTADEAPLIKQWLDRNKKPFELVMEATTRQHYYRPLIGSDQIDAMIAFPLPDIQQHREIAWMLKSRALLAIGENRPEDAIRDLMAMHRMARHSAQGATLIDMLVGVALEAIAHHGDQQLVNSGKVTADQLTRYAKQLAKLPPPAQTNRNFTTERFVGLDVIQRLAAQKMIEEEGDTGILELLELEPGSETMNRLMTVLFQYGIDWNTVLIGFNEYHDQIQAALELKDYSQRTAAMQELVQDLEAKVKNDSKPANLALAIFATPEQRARQMTNLLLGLLVPALEQVHGAATRGEARANLSQLGVALSAYQKKTGAFPETLDALVPKYLPQLPNDPYTGNSFVYRIDNEGALVYSLGKNLTDDGGKPLDDDYEKYDHVFRVTRP